MLNTLEELPQYLQDRMTRMQTLIADRRRATPAQIAAVDEAMDKLYQDMAADLEKSRHRTPDMPELSKRLRRMVQLTLEEITEQRDKARQERRVDG